MLAVLIYVTEMVRRMLRKITRSVWIVADSFREAQEIRRSMPRVYAEE
ncbi:MAG TPA: hypothetical protein VFK79_07360 [Xanthobacteraceae bacterium]|nr:hypothetical protein [Xanthobacteraceae bacterium]